MNNLAPPIMNNGFTPRVYNLDERHFQEYATEKGNYQKWLGNCKPTGDYQKLIFIDRV